MPRTTTSRDENLQDDSDLAPGERPCTSIKMKSISSFFNTSKSSTVSEAKTAKSHDIVTKDGVKSIISRTSIGLSASQTECKPEPTGKKSGTIGEKLQAKSKHVTVEETKKELVSVSYEDFLKSTHCENPAVVEDVVLCDDSLSPQETSENSVDNMENSEKVEPEDGMSMKPKGCVSISSFFCKVSKASVKPPEVNKTVTVKAMVHTQTSDSAKIILSASTFSSEGKGKKKKKNQGKSNVVVDHLDMSIICLDSEDIVAVKSDTNVTTVKSEKEDLKCQNGRLEESTSAKTTDKDLISTEPEQVKLTLETETHIIEETLPAIQSKQSSRDVNKNCQQRIASESIERQKPAKDFAIFSKRTKQTKEIIVDTDSNSTSSVKIVTQKEEEEVTITSEVRAGKSNMAALDRIKTEANKKTSQATLSFGKSGVEVKKTVVRSQEISENAQQTKTKEESKVAKEAPKKEKKLKKGKTAEITPATETTALKEKSGTVKKRGRKPLKAAKQKASMSKAAQLVARARGQQASRKASVAAQIATPPSTESSQPPRRSSSRLAKSAAVVAIALEVEEMDAAELTEPKKRTRNKTDEKLTKAEADSGEEESNTKSSKKKGKPSVGKKEKRELSKNEAVNENKGLKTAKEKSPQKKAAKAGVKLAPLFCKKPAKGDEDVVVIEDEGQERVMTAEMRSFLLSGVPEAMKRQRAMAEAVAAMAEATEYAPWPTYSHVQQRDKSKYWSLPLVDLPCRVSTEEPLAGYVSQWNTTQRIEKTERKPLLCCGERPEIGDATLKLLLAEIATQSRTYPVRRVYRQLQQHQRQPANTTGAAGISAQPSIESVATEKPAINGVEKNPITKKRRRPSEDWSVVVSVSDSEEEVEPVPKRRPSLRLSLRKSSRSKAGSDEVQVTEKVEVKAKVTEKSEVNGKVTETVKVKAKGTEKVEVIDKVIDKAHDNINSIKNSRTASKSSSDSHVEKAENSVSSKSSVGAEEQWTEKYAPRCAAEVLGNTRCVERLRSWLQDWKEQTCREMRRIQQQQQQQDSKENGEKRPWWDSDDSDFAPGSEEDDTRGAWEDMGIGNTMLLTGPPGVGKTAAVYALAQQLGYKVFEVNATSRRSGKQVLTDLQEATQSHQVRHNGAAATTATPSDIPPVLHAAPALSTKTPKSKKLPTAFAGFFKKSDSPKSPGTPKGKRKPEIAKSPRGKTASPRAKRTKRKADDDVEITGETASPRRKTPGRKKGKASVAGLMSVNNTTEAKKKGLDLSSVSLILFEEVDVVFEEDRGFWAAVQTFMHTTKRPIILTTSDPGFLRRFDPRAELRLETLAFRSPPMSHVSAYLQLVCLAEGRRTSAQDVAAIVRTLRGDVRRCLLATQLWSQSSADPRPHPLPIRYSKHALSSKQATVDEGFSSQPIEEASQTAPLAVFSKTNSEDEFESPVKPFGKRRRCQAKPISEEDSPIKVTRRKRRQLIKDEDEPSRESTPQPSVSVAEEWSQGESQQSVAEETCVEESMESVALTDEQPAMHSGLLMVTATGDSTHSDMLKLLDQGDLPSAVAVLSSFPHPPCHLVCTNLLHLLHLPTEIRAPATYTSLSTIVLPKFSRIKNNDLFDSEGDDEESNTVDVMTASPVKVQTENIKKKTGTLTEDDRLLGEAMNNLSELYDNISFADSHLTHGSDINSRSLQNFDIGLGSLGAGQLDEFRLEDEREVLLSEAADWVSLGSVRQCRSVVGRVRDASGSGGAVEKALTVPIAESQETLQIDGETETAKRLRTSRHHAAQSVYDALNPPRVGARRHAAAAAAEGTLSFSVPTAPVAKRAVLQDYLPMLRTLCKGEQARQAAKTKRRFLHYLDQIHLNLKQSTLDTLCSSFS